ncbi:MAG: hypothetical protein JST73_08620 [Actinobacteria bacterium]|nr:hypothetical protein [Actinomycetota bacterium]
MWFALKIVIAIVVAYAMFRVGLAILRMLSTPPPEPPPPGELRKVKLVYRCAVCGTELRMTLANDEVPEAPRHCMEEMELLGSPDI